MNRPLGGGPSNGMYALQKALREEVARRGIDWFVIDGPAEPDDLIWFWNWQDIGELLEHDADGRPWVTGPNILFGNSRCPGAGYGERILLESPHCRLIFTESAWYERLIRRHRGSANTAPIVLWPYPIDPQPAGPLPARYDVLIYAKSGPEGLAEEIAARYARSKILRYGQFSREELYAAARRSRSCVYLSDDDRGPLALAEILLSGCPAVGIERGAPFVEPGRSGIRVDRLEVTPIVEALEDLLEWDRTAVRRRALAVWDAQAIAETVLDALDDVRTSVTAI
jgi:hypothetical protein